MKHSASVLTAIALGLCVLAQPGHAQSINSLSQLGYNQQLANEAINLTPASSLPGVSVLPSDEAQVLAAVNTIRGELDQKPLTLDSALTEAARYELLSESCYPYYGNFGMLANGVTEVSGQQMASAFGSTATGVLSAQGTNSTMLTFTGNYVKLLTNWYGQSALFRQIAGGSSYTTVGIGVVNSGLTENVNGTTYPVVCWCILAGTGNAAAPPTITAPVVVSAPSAPGAPSVVAGNASVAVSWSGVSGATSYNVYRSTASGQESLYKSGLSGTQLSDTGLNDGTTYYYEVTAVGAGGESGKSAQAGATPHASSPSVSAASASPSTVTGASTSLSVQGSDPQSESLSYSWSASGPAPVTFTANNSSGAASTTATFSAIGSYTFSVTATDTSGLSATSQVSVTVTPTLTTAIVAPATATLTVGQTQSFTATGLDQFGKSVSVSPSWSVIGGGTVSGSGVFTAGSAGGPYVVTASSGNISGTAQVTVNSAQLLYTAPSLLDLLGANGYNTSLAGEAISLTQSSEVPNVNVLPTDEAQVLAAINTIRGELGQNPLTVDPALSEAARYELLCESYYPYYGNFGMLANASTEVSGQEMATQFESPATGVLSAQGTNSTMLTFTGNYVKLLTNWYGQSSLFRQIAGGSSYTTVGIGVVNSGLTESANGTTYPVLCWCVLAGH